MRIMTGDLHDLFEAGAVGSWPDSLLLERFVAQRDDRAFEALVRRHGILVWGVCRRILADHHRAEDAFQATFVVLARRAGALRPGATLAPWLYGVARRTATKARAIAARRQAREQAIVADLPARPLAAPPDLLPVLDHELGRLPERYRTAIVLCDLEGFTRREAATQLGWPEGTLASRLARGRSLLAGRLTRHGFAAPLGAAAGWTHQIPPTLIPTTVRTVAELTPTTGWIGAGIGPSYQAGGLLSRPLIALTLTLVGTIGGGLAYRATASGQPRPQPRPLLAVAVAEDPPGPASVSSLFARLVLNQVVAAVPAVEDIEQRVWLLCETARVQGQTGLTADRAATLKLATTTAQESESEHRLDNVAEAMALAGDARPALDLVAPLRLNRDAGLDHIAAALAQTGDILGAQQVAAAIQTEPYRGEAGGKIALAQSNQGDPDGALATIQTIADPTEQAQALITLAGQQIRAGSPAAAQTLDQARRTTAQIPPHPGPDGQPSDGQPSSRAELAGVLARAGATDEATALARTITKAPWRDIAWVHIVRAQSERHQPEAALATVESIRTSSQKGEALLAIIQDRLKQADLAQARSLVERIEAPYERIHAQIVLAQAQYRRGARTEASTAFAAIRQSIGQIPDLRPGSGNLQASAASLLARAQGEVGDEATAQAWIDQPGPPLVRAWALLGLAQGMATRVPAPPPTPVVRLAPDVVRLALVPRPSLAPPIAEPAGPIETFRSKVVLFGVQRSVGAREARIERMNPDGTGMESILTLDAGQLIAGGRVAPDGQHLAYSVTRQGSDAAELWLLATDRTRRLLAANLFVVAWSPDSTRLLGFRAVPERRGEYVQVILTIATGTEQVLSLPAADVVNDWSPDGQTLAVMAGNRDHVYQHPTKGTYPLRQIYLWNLATAKSTLVTTKPTTDTIDARFGPPIAAQSTPNGQRLVYPQRRFPGDKVQQWMVVQDLVSETTRDLADFQASYAGDREYRPNGPPCCAPDGLSVVWFIPRRKLQSSPTRCELLFISLQRGVPDRRLKLDPLGIDWVQDLDWR